MSNQQSPMPIIVFYDGKCGLCSKEINYYMKLDKEDRFKWVDITVTTDELENIGISQSDALMNLHALDNHGNLNVGVDAFILMWRHLPGWRVLATVTSLPLIKSFAQFAYRLFARWRFNRLGYCELPTKQLKNH